MRRLNPMQHTTLKPILLAVSVGGFLVACASCGNSSGSGNGESTTVPPDAGRADAGKTGTDAACVPACNVDAECQNSCPAVSTGVNCCDVTTHICYAASDTMCPMPKIDAGTMNPPY